MQIYSNSIDINEINEKYNLPHLNSTIKYQKQKRIMRGSASTTQLSSSLITENANNNTNNNSKEYLSGSFNMKDVKVDFSKFKKTIKYLINVIAGHEQFIKFKQINEDDVMIQIDSIKDSLKELKNTGPATFQENKTEENDIEMIGGM